MWLLLLKFILWHNRYKIQLLRDVDIINEHGRTIRNKMLSFLLSSVIELIFFVKLIENHIQIDYCNIIFQKMSQISFLVAF